MGKLVEKKMKVTVTGKSGSVYEFDVYTLDTEFIEMGGVYIYCKRVMDDISDGYGYVRIYCGKTKNLSTRFENHHKEVEIMKYGANCICVKSVGTEEERTRIEKDILAANDFPLNEVNN
jgi:hypothetical protein